MKLLSRRRAKLGTSGGQLPSFTVLLAQSCDCGDEKIYCKRLLSCYARAGHRHRPKWQHAASATHLYTAAAISPPASCTNRPLSICCPVAQGEGTGSAPEGSTRRLVLTSAALLERRSDSYEVAERRQLAQLAALVRFIDQPQWLALEWTDGAPPAMYITPAREALLTALLDAAQVSVGATAVVFAC